METLGSLDQVPVLHVRGTHYAIGYSIGRTYLSFIQNYLGTLKFFPEVLLPLYSTAKGRKAYDTSLELCQRKYPQYVQEIQGIADGAGVPFHHLFLLHVEPLIVRDSEETSTSTATEGGGALLGCTSVLCNNDDVILGHTEDAPPEMANHFFIVSAQIVDEKGVTLEKWSTLTYPGYLPGYTMGFNHHGIVYSVNAICPCQTYADRTPVHFITRALLAAKDEREVLSIVKDGGTGIGDAFSLNLFFVQTSQDNPAVVGCNIEIGPSRSKDSTESEIDVHWVNKGESYVHCNKFLRLDTPLRPFSLRSTLRRHRAIEKLSPPTSLGNVKDILSDRSDVNFPVFRSAPPFMTEEEQKDEGRDSAATICIGLFNITKRTWSLYTKPPNVSQPVVELPLDFSLVGN